MITPDMLARSGTEHGEQAAFFCWASQWTNPHRQDLIFMHAIPNGGLRNPATAAALKAEGVKSGIADIFLPVPTYENWQEGRQFNVVRYCGLYIEMKRVDSTPSKWSKEQRDFCTEVERRGYAYFVAYGWIEAARIVEAYLNAEPIRRLANGRLGQPT